MTAIALLIGIGLTATPMTGEPASPDGKVESEKTKIVEVRKVVRDGEIGKAEAEAIIASCGPRKFETEAVSNNNGKARKAKILLCAKDGEADSDWIAKLEKAASTIGASSELSVEAKAKIAGDIQSEIERLKKAQ